MINYNEKFRLDKKTVVVCGGLGLLGKEMTIAFASVGAKVLVLDIDKEKGEALKKELKQKKMNIEFMRFDVTEIKKIKEFIGELFNKENIHAWVNTAYPRTKDWGDKLEDVSVESWQKNVDMHMNSYCIITRDVAEMMKKSKIQGSIINLSSIYGIVSPDFEVYNGTTMTSPAAYSAIKGAISNFSRYTATYYGRYGIRVNTLCPGGIFDNQNPVFVKNYEKKTPLKRMGDKSEIAAAAIFLASDASSYITGIDLMIDGGWTAI